MSTSLRRAIAIHLLGLIGVAICLAAAHWQWDRAHTARASDVRVVDFPTASPLRQFMPVSSIAASTSVEGTWVPGWRAVIDRPADGTTVGNLSTQNCLWIVDALLLDDGSAIAIVRGCTNQTPFPTSSGREVISGILQPSEDSGIAPLAPDQQKLTTRNLVAQLNLPMHDGYLVQVPPAQGLRLVTPILPNPVSVPLHWRNIVYVFNWLVFAAIVVAMWVRVVADERRSASTHIGGGSDV